MRNTTGDSFDDMTIEELYERMKPIARNLMRGQSPSHTLGQPSALVNEVFVRMRRFYPELAASPAARRAIAKQAAAVMRNILIDHWKSHHRDKRTGDCSRVPLTLVDGAGRTTRDPIDIVAFDDLMNSLAVSDPLAAQVVDMRFFGGMSMREVAAETETDLHVVENAWSRAKKWLAHQLGNQGSQQESGEE